MNWKVSESNQPAFNQVFQYNGLIIYYINELYESIFGFPKYVNCELSTKYIVETSPYGIVPLDK